MNDFFNTVYWGNSVRAYAFALGSIILAWIILKVVKRFIIAALKKLASRTDSQYDDVIVSAAEKFLIPYLYLLINYNIITQLNLSAKVDHVLSVAMSLITMVYAVRLVTHAFHKSVELYMQHKNEPPERLKQLNGILLVVKIVVWGIGLLMLFDNLGYDVTTIVAGLGVGGIAIALAAQNILSDLFSYFVIFFDKPFEIGDFIIVGPSAGTVERIGIKTSHVRSISGEQLIMPNAELVKSTIKNYKRLQRRRNVFSTGVIYETSEELLQQIPSIIRSVIEKQKDATFDRCHLSGFGDFSINFETVYFVETPDFLVHMNVQQSIYLDVFKAFAEKGIEFAYPTQVLYVNKADSAPEADRNNR